MHLFLNSEKKLHISWNKDKNNSLNEDKQNIIDLHEIFINSLESKEVNNQKSFLDIWKNQKMT